jgi:hypothetical protein
MVVVIQPALRPFVAGVLAARLDLHWVQLF